jgi:hypothetical protein
MVIGVYTFAETTPDPRTGRTISAAERIRDLLEEIELADQVGLDGYGVGEHRPRVSVGPVVRRRPRGRHGFLRSPGRRQPSRIPP